MTVEFFGCKDFDLRTASGELSLAIDGVRFKGVTYEYEFAFTPEDEEEEADVCCTRQELESCALYYISKCCEKKKKIPDFTLDNYYLRVSEKDKFLISAEIMKMMTSDVSGSGHKSKPVVRKKMKGKKRNKNR